MQKEHVTMT